MAGKSQIMALASLLFFALLLHAALPTQGEAFLQAAGATRASGAAPQLPGSERPRVGAAESRSFGTTAFGAVGLAAVAGLAAAAAKANNLRRRTKGSYNLDTRMPSGTFVTMTRAEQDKWIAEKSADLEELLPLSDADFEDQVVELEWQWARHLLSYVDRNRVDYAREKRITIFKQRAFFEKFRLFKPLCMKYPTLLKRMIKYDPDKNTFDPENRDMLINAQFLNNAEHIAGFTYKDFVVETNGNKFDNWTVPQVGDIVSGTIVDINEDGAFVDIGSKCWALLPVSNASLKPISTIGQAGKSIGDEIEAMVVATGAPSKVPGDSSATQEILSLKEMEFTAAWDRALRVWNSEEGTENIFTVTVLRMENWGAVVMNEDGLQGVIMVSELGNKAGDARMVGRAVEVSILQMRPNCMENQDPRRPNDFALVFSYKDVAKKALAKELEEGMVVEAKVLLVLPAVIEIEVRGTSCPMTKMNMSSATNFNVEDVFKVDDIIKVYVLSTLDKDGSIKFSTRALERKRGAMLRNKAKVFEMAEDTAKLFFQKSQIEKEKTLSGLQSVLDDDLGDDFLKAPKKKASKAPSSVLGDDDDLGGGF